MLSCFLTAFVKYFVTCYNIILCEKNRPYIFGRQHINLKIGGSYSVGVRGDIPTEIYNNNDVSNNYTSKTNVSIHITEDDYT